MAKTPKTKTDSLTSLLRRIRIRKVKLVGGKTFITYEARSTVSADGWDSFELKSNDEPVPEMIIAIKSLAPQVCEVCELPQEWESNVVVHSVALSYSGDDTMFTGAVISARKVLLNGGSPFMFNTPHRPVTSKNKDLMLPPEAVILMEEICEHAEEFINGKRQQKSLFEDEEFGDADGVDTIPAFADEEEE
jgi:hypothetical protein